MTWVLNTLGLFDFGWGCKLSLNPILTPDTSWSIKGSVHIVYHCGKNCTLQCHYMTVLKSQVPQLMLSGLVRRSLFLRYLGEQSRPKKWASGILKLVRSESLAAAAREKRSAGPWFFPLRELKWEHRIFLLQFFLYGETSCMMSLMIKLKLHCDSIGEEG